MAGIYLYGQPRVGDYGFTLRFCRAYGDRSFRIRTAQDIVPFLLPKWLGYRCDIGFLVLGFGFLVLGSGFGVWVFGFWVRLNL